VHILELFRNFQVDVCSVVYLHVVCDSEVLTVNLDLEVIVNLVREAVIGHFDLQKARDIPMFAHCLVVADRGDLELVANLCVGVLKPVHVLLHDGKSLFGVAWHPVLLIPLPFTKFHVSRWNTKCIYHPICSMTSRQDSKSLNNLSNIGVLSKSCFPGDFIKSLVHLWVFLFEIVWKQPSHRNEPHLTSAVEVVYKLDLILMPDHKVPHRPCLWL
jgi:hypothetical protein